MPPAIASTNASPSGSASTAASPSDSDRRASARSTRCASAIEANIAVNSKGLSPYDPAMRMRSVTIVILTGFNLSAMAPVPHAQPVLSPEEQAIVKFVDANNEDALKLLERVVNINSGTQNLAGVREVGKLFRAELDALGFKTTWVEGTTFKRAGHLVAEHPGAGPKMLLIGHLDTVFEKDSPFQKFERMGPTSARGPGIIDMKGGDVIIIQALKALNAAGALKAMDVTVVMTGDEEDPGEPQSAARAALVAAAKGKDIAIGFEDGAMDPKTAIVAR